MGRLQTRLDRIREGFTAQAPPEALEVVHRATADLRASGILDGVPRSGDRLPDFDLKDSEGNGVQSAALLKNGKLVVSFYRGVW